MKMDKTYQLSLGVAPRAGAWIETGPFERGGVIKIVAPRAGAWIETMKKASPTGVSPRRTPCGCVD